MPSVFAMIDVARFVILRSFYHETYSLTFFYTAPRPQTGSESWKATIETFACYAKSKRALSLFSAYIMVFLANAVLQSIFFFKQI